MLANFAFQIDIRNAAARGVFDVRWRGRVFGIEKEHAVYQKKKKNRNNLRCIKRLSVLEVLCAAPTT